jgi:putative FmdB family regulatory protein
LGFGGAYDPWRGAEERGIIARGTCTMPMYEFACLDCGREFTLILSLREYERKDVSCPQCKSKSIERLVTTCEVITSRKS